MNPGRYKSRYVRVCQEELSSWLDEAKGIGVEWLRFSPCVIGWIALTIILFCF